MASAVTSTLLLRFAAPQQSWGSTELADRNTEAVPTRSGVIGLLAAALGAPRGSWPEWLWATEIWARVDRRGELATDFHTVGIPSAEAQTVRTRHRAAVGGRGEADFIIPLGSGAKWTVGGGTLVTNRQYLADAEFLVAIGHADTERVRELAQATHNPVFMTYLGRKSFSPSFPFHLGVRDSDPQQVLRTLPTHTSSERGLTLHQLLGDRNYATETVHPHVSGALTGWATT